MSEKKSYEFVPYEYPKSRDGKYICLLDDGQVLRSRREQLGLSVQQVAQMAGLQFSQYQRLEAGDRFFSGCSMKVGLSVCAVLLLDPFDFFHVDVQQADPTTMKPHEPFDFDLPEDLIRPKKVGRKPIRRDIMSIYVNHPHFSFILPRNVLVALGQPAYIQIQWNTEEKRLLFQPVDADADQAFDVPDFLYSDATALVFPPMELLQNVKSELGWDNEAYAVECRLVRGIKDDHMILCDLNTAVQSECIPGPFVMPACIDMDNDGNDDGDDSAEENEDDR